ncbi:hypothetical protein QVD17_21842 [Tagetes erecta]|uniref:AP2/ERF domain-containing protein n=1 Tax=Tagetes erecta TaxID=13708 RepID=A0AAD8NTP9_TARER|nr:hypothetical protein QVD17_21842 [Tagetes erecta]
MEIEKKIRSGMADEIFKRFPVAMRLEETTSCARRKLEREQFMKTMLINAKTEAECSWNGLIGVEQKTHQLFGAYIRNPLGVKRRRDIVGFFLTPEEAAAAYDQEAYRRYGSTALLNYPNRLIATDDPMMTSN